MTTTGKSSASYHYISASPLDLNYKLLVEIDMTLQVVRSAREHLMNTPFVIGRGEYIKPVECDQAVKISNDIRDMAAKISYRLDSIDKLQVLSTTNYYKLLMQLYSASDRSTTLSEILVQFRSVCTETSLRRRSLYFQTVKELSAFIQICEKLEVEIDEMLNSVFTQNLAGITRRLPVHV